MVSLKDVTKLTVVACAGAFLAIVVLVVVAFATRLLTVQKIGTVVKVLRGEPVTLGYGRGLPKDLMARYDMEALEEARRAVEDLGKQEELLALKLNERRSDMKKLETDAGRIRKELTDRADALARAQTAFREERSAYAAQLRSAGFRKLVTAFQNMSEKDAARLLYDGDIREAAEVVKALESDRRGRIIVEITRRDRLPENSGKEGKAGKLMKLIREGDGEVVTLKAE